MNITRDTQLFQYTLPNKGLLATKKKLLSGSILFSKGAIIALSTSTFILMVVLVATGLSLGVSKAPYNTSCGTQRQCEPSELTTCVVNEQKCLCNTLAYWNGKKCVHKKSINDTCETSDECREDHVLNCESNRCLCGPTLHWNGTQCLYKRTYNESCTQTSECAEHLNLTCSSNKCDCVPKTTLFWNNQECELKREFNKSCKTNDWCNSLNNSLQCISISWQNSAQVGVCSCNSTQYYDTSQQKCLSTRAFSSSGCVSNNECDTLRGLVCLSSTCTCSHTHYFNGTFCIAKNTFNQVCAVQSTAFGQLPICNNNIGLICSNFMCVCNATQFWSNIQQRCINFLNHGSQCTSNSECIQSNSLICSNGFCQCNTTQYFDSISTQKCQNKLSNGSSCSSHVMCQTYNGLFCRSSICQCNISQSFYANPGICSSVQRLCVDYYNLGIRTDGIYPIYVNSTLTKWLRCDMTRGGWTVIAAKHTIPSLIGQSQFIAQFDKPWSDFRHGFGTPSLTYWSGLDFMHYLTNTYSLRYRVDAWNSASDFLFVERASLQIDNEANKYRITIGTATSTNGAGTCSGSQGMFFTTYDNDNDLYGGNCANNGHFYGGWWHSSCYCDCITCTNQNQLNYNPGNIWDGVQWRFFDLFEMKVL